MASRFIYPCGCAECGEITYFCEEHKNTADFLQATYDMVIARPNSCVILEGVGVGKKVEETIVVDAKTGGAKGSKLARFDLIPPDALWKVAEVYGEGAKKYAARNWEKGYAWGLGIAALERHLNLFKQREDIDPETQCYHTAQVAWHALALLTFQLRNLGTDDRTVIMGEAK